MSLQYITNQQGDRIGVLLDLDTYQRLTTLSEADPELLTGLSYEELQALAESVLVPAAQAQLSDLLNRNAENQISAEEIEVLDRLLAQVDALNVLKTRARYTLQQLSEVA
jgi:hypothetical protein